MEKIYTSELCNFDTYSRRIESIASAVENIDLPQKELLVFVDVGCSDCRLTRVVMDSLSKTYKLRAYGFDPDISVISDTNGIKLEQLDLESWLKKYKAMENSVDLVLNSHTFYHFPVPEWKNIIHDINALLSDEGKHVIVIDSEKTAFNQLNKAFRDLEKTEAYGEYLVGSAVEEFLKSQEIDYKHSLITESISLPRNHNSLKELARILAFEFRCSHEDILKFKKKELSEFISKHTAGNSYIFPVFQDIFILIKNNI